MSPLARSLLALSALLAAADSLDPECSETYIGVVSGTPYPLLNINIRSPGDVINISLDACEDAGLGVIAGALIEACNQEPGGPAPVVRASGLTPITINCQNDSLAKITLFCKL